MQRATVPWKPLLQDACSKVLCLCLSWSFSMHCQEEACDTLALPGVTRPVALPTEIQAYLCPDRVLPSTLAGRYGRRSPRRRATDRHNSGHTLSGALIKRETLRCRNTVERSRGLTCCSSRRHSSRCHRRVSGEPGDSRLVTELPMSLRLGIRLMVHGGPHHGPWPCESSWCPQYLPSANGSVGKLFLVKLCFAS